jgi:putative ABC transport system permease protein
MDKAILHRNALADENYFKLLDIKLKAGRDLIFEVDSFSWENPNRRIIVNETSLKELSIPFEKAVGTRILTEWEGQVFTHEIVGVVEDFHQFSLRQKITPLLFYIPANRSNYTFLVASIKGGDYKNIISQMESKWDELVARRVATFGSVEDLLC